MNPRISLFFSGLTRTCLHFHLPLFSLLAALVLLHFYVGIREYSFFWRNYTDESNNRSLHVLLVSYSRSGSNFVGELLGGFPESYYYFEPLQFLSDNVLNGSEVNNRARDLLSNLFQCNASEEEGFIDWQKKRPKIRPDITYTDSGDCFTKKIVVIKTIRLKLSEVAELFADPNLHLKVIYLVRDPRGTLFSRNKFPIHPDCQEDVHCHDYRYFCSLLEDDMKAVCHVLHEREKDILVVHYENLSANPLPTVKLIVKFLGMEENPEIVDSFLKNNAVFEDKAAEFSVKEQRLVVREVSWQNEVNFRIIREIQDRCQNVLDFFGYQKYPDMKSLLSSTKENIVLEAVSESKCIGTSTKLFVKNSRRH